MSRPRAILVLALFYAIVAWSIMQAPESRSEPRPEPRRETCPDARHGLRFYSRHIGRHRFRLAWADTPHLHGANPSPGRPRDCDRVRLQAASRRARSRHLRRMFDAWYDAMLDKWGCIHRLEGAWNDPNPPYYGGLQMDLTFQSSYGREYLERFGTADRWPIWAQLRAAERAHRTRGFQPWPNTARMCGLL
jgi:hypothetical protein